MSEDSHNAPSKAAALNLEFHGQGFEYFKIWFVNILLSVLTLGIYSAWAKVRTKRYFYGNTVLDDSAFEYHATPMAILKGRLIAVAMLVVYVLVSQMMPMVGAVLAIVLALAFPWVIWRGFQFNARMSSYRNVHFAFAGELKDAYKYLLLLPLAPLLLVGLIAGGSYVMGLGFNMGFAAMSVVVSVLAIYLMIPWMQKLMSEYYIGNMQYGQGQFSTRLSTGLFYGAYLILIGVNLLVILGLVAAFASVLSALGLGGSMAGGGLAAAQAVSASPVAAIALGLMAVVFYLVMIAMALWSKAYLKARLRNHIYANTELDDVMQLGSSLSSKRLFGVMITNALMIIFTLGLAYPWAKIRLTHYLVEHTEARITGDADQYVTQQQQKQSALGDEMDEAFDMDLGLAV